MQFCALAFVIDHFLSHSHNPIQILSTFLALKQLFIIMQMASKISWIQFLWDPIFRFWIIFKTLRRSKEPLRSTCFECGNFFPTLRRVFSNWSLQLCISEDYLSTSPISIFDSRFTFIAKIKQFTTRSSSISSSSQVFWSISRDLVYYFFIVK